MLGRIRFRSRIAGLVLAGLVAACGVSAEDQAKTYILNEGRIDDAITIWGQTLAVSGRHASIPNGLDLASSGPVCLGGDTEGTVSAMILGCQDTGDSVSCLLPETYDCNYVQGSLEGSVVSSDSAMTVALASTSYTEGSVALLGVELLYNGKITVTTTAAAARIDQVIELSVSDYLGTTVYNNRAYWNVVTEEDLVLFSGTFTLPTELGDLTIESTDVAFQPGITCAGPVQGRFDLRFGTTEHARILVQACGTAKLQYINTNDPTIIESELELTPDILRGAFSLSAADIGGFLKASDSLSQHTLLYDPESVKPAIWCRLFESTEAVPLFAQYVSGTRANPVAGSPVAECLLTMTGVGGPKFIAGTIAFTRGLNGDMTAVKVLGAASGTITMATDGASAVLTFEQFGAPTLVDDLDHLTAASWWTLTGTCPSTIDGCEHLPTSPWTSYGSDPTTVSVELELNHFGAWMTVGDTSANYFAVTLPE